MALGCFSGLCCFRQRPSQGVDGIVSSDLVPTGATQHSSDGGVRGTAAVEITSPRSPLSPGSADIPVPTPIQDSLQGSTGVLTPALIEPQPTGPHSPEGNVNFPDLAHAGEVPSASPASGPTYRLDPAKAEEHIRHIPRFRILVIGRANAGKTTILQRVCSTTDHPKIYNGKGRKVNATVVQGSLTRGHHNIEDELVFRSNPRFVFHDSCGFEAGSEEQFDLMTKFVMDRAKTSKLNERIHAIWFCIPLTDGHRLVTAAETKFFEVCDTGHVPVIVLATKADTLELEAIERLEDERFGADDSVGPEEMAKEILKNYMARLKTWLGNARFPPRDYLPLKGMQREDAGCTSLITCTANALREQGLQQLLISTQQSNLKLCMNFAIMKTLKKCMSKHVVNIRPVEVAFLLALWFPYNNYGLKIKHWKMGVLGGLWLVDDQGYQGVHGLKLDQGVLLYIKQLLHYYGQGYGYDGFQIVDDHLVPTISHAAFALTMPTLSTSKTYSMQYIAEHGIGSILVFEYLYFLLQARSVESILQEHLNLAVETYQSSGVHARVNRLIQEAFQMHGENAEAICPILVDIAGENQLSKILSRNR